MTNDRQAKGERGAGGARGYGGVFPPRGWAKKPRRYKTREKARKGTMTNDGQPNGQRGTRGVTLWFTGLPCSGKSTIAQIAGEELRRRGHRVELLDGDEVRQHLTKGPRLSQGGRRPGR